MEQAAADLSTEERIRQVVLRKVNRPGLENILNYDTPLLELGIDSILALTVLVELEKEFDFEIDDRDLNIDVVKT
ncbi:MAG: acyl carrier protein, partial [Acetobacteraceae bacterium]|nr:acyl carrier protein [Acetobacteraceae bacterium]